MISKAFQLSIELDVHAITCPGVWLCPNNGDLSLSIFMLDSYGETSNLYPVFPLLIHEKFLFNKTIQSANSLGDLQDALNNEYFYCELVQWSLECRNVGSVLANFQTRLGDLLYPSFHRDKKVAGVDVELLMEASKSFPGIIAPKIEVSTKTTVKEITTRKALNNTCAVNPKTLRSCKVYQRTPLIMQKSVCHSDFYKCNKKNRNVKCKRSSRKCNCTTPLILQMNKSCTPCVHHTQNDLEQIYDTECRLRSGANKKVKRHESPTHNKLEKRETATKCFVSHLKKHTDSGESDEKCHGMHFCCSTKLCPCCLKYQEYFNQLSHYMKRCKSVEDCSTSAEGYRTNSALESASTIDVAFVDSARKVHHKVSSILQTSPEISDISKNCQNYGVNDVTGKCCSLYCRLQSGNDRSYNKNQEVKKSNKDLKQTLNTNTLKTQSKFKEKQMKNDQKYTGKVKNEKCPVKTEKNPRPNSSMTSEELKRRKGNCPSCSPEQKYKIMFYENLEAFYKNLYEKVREKANKEREHLN